MSDIEMSYETAKQVDCPTCAAKPGDDCVTQAGARMALLHPRRWRRAKKRVNDD